MIQTKSSCISAVNKSTPDSMSATGMAVFELSCGLCRTTVCQTITPKEQDSSQIHVTLFICLAVKQQFNIRWLYWCPMKVDYMNGEMFKFAFWQWDNISWSSSWSLGTKEPFCTTSTPGNTSGICNFISIYMAFYSLTLTRCWGTSKGHLALSNIT